MAKIIPVNRPEPKLKNYLARYDMDDNICKAQYESSGQVSEFMKAKLIKDMNDILTYVFNHKEEFMKLDL